jgi:hypothetical protein
MKPTRSGGDQRHAACVLRLAGTVHDPGNLPELPPHLDHHATGGASHREHAEGAE